MAFSDCIREAQAQGALSKKDADYLIARYEAHVAGRRFVGEPEPEQAAKVALTAELQAQAARQRKLAALATEKRDEIAYHFETFRNAEGKPDVYEAAMRVLENFGYAGTSSVRGRFQAIVALEHANLSDVLREFERNFYTGMRHQTVKIENVVKEMLGEATGSPEAKAFAQAMSGSFERLRGRFNAAGGDIGHIEGGYIPQYHDPLSLYKAGFEKWRDFILPKLDPEKMRDPLTGEPMTPQRLAESLEPAYKSIISESWFDREPGSRPQGNGALANQRADHRFFKFKSADDWLAYNGEFGRGDPVKAMFGHVNGMARDIAALEVLGPNPSATVEWMKQVTLSEHAKQLTGDASLFAPSGLQTARGAMDAGAAAAKQIDDLWYWTRGRETVRQGVANFFSNVRNVLTSAQLGSAVITAATTDPAIERMALRQLGISDGVLFGHNAKVYLDTVSRYFEQVPIAKSISHVIDWFTGAPREQAARAGMVMDDFLHVLGDEARYAGTLGGSVWSRWLADRIVTLSGLTPLTEARRSVFQLEVQGHIADNAGKPFAELPDTLRNKLAGYGFDAKQWDELRAVPAYEPAPGAAGFLRPSDVALGNRTLAERYAEMLAGETERAVPTATLRSKAYVLSSRPKGQIGGEIADSFLQYKSFGLSVLTLQMEAIARETQLHGQASGASYAAQLFLLTTLGGAAALQLKAMANGKDPATVVSPKFWINAMATGGGMGIMGDFLFADTSRYGYSPAEQLAGPTVGLVGDVMKFTLGNMTEFAQGKDMHLGRETTQMIGRYTPIVSSLWATRLAFKREILDQLQYQIDPHAAKSWRDQERKALKDQKQGTWWPAGQTAPARAPDLGTAIK